MRKPVGLTLAGALAAAGIAVVAPIANGSGEPALGDLVWVDLNRNGVQEAGEPGAPGITVTVRNADGAEVGSATTDAGGHYLVEGLADGGYLVCFGLSSDYADFVVTQANAGTDDALDSDADRDGCTAQAQLAPGHRENLTVDAGIVSPPNRVGDGVWVDLDRNGLWDTGEPGVAGASVVVKDGNGNRVGTAATDENGRYLVGNLPDGTFIVCFGMSALPSAYADYRITKPNAGDDELDSDVYPNSGCTEPVNLGPGNRENLTVDAGIVRPTNRLGDRVWIDSDLDGLQDAGEPAAPGVPAVLIAGSVAVARATTGNSGKYLFDNLEDGTYRVCFVLAELPRYMLTQPGVGEDREIDSDADPASGCTAPVVLGAGRRVDLTVDAGLLAPDPAHLFEYDTVNDSPVR